MVVFQKIFISALHKENFKLKEYMSVFSQQIEYIIFPFL